MSGSDTPQEAISFGVEFYKQTRAHEVALGTATAAYEQSLLRLVLVLNAASIGAFLALLESVKIDSTVGLSIAVSRVAIIVWIIGTGLAFYANWCAYKSQEGFAEAYSKLRRAAETRLAPRDKEDPLLSENLGTPPGITFGSDKAKEAHSNAENKGKEAKHYGAAAAGAAFVGVMLAFGAIHSQSIDKHNAPTRKSVGFELFEQIGSH